MAEDLGAALAAHDQYLLEDDAVNGDKPGNPPSWVADEGAWEKAKEVARAIDADGKLEGDSIYPFASWYYLNRLEGTTKELIEKGGPGSGPRPGQSHPHSGHGNLDSLHSSGNEVHSIGHTRDQAIQRAKELRSKGQFATIWHTGGPKTGPKSQYAIGVPAKKEIVKMSDSDAAALHILNRGKDEYGAGPHVDNTGAGFMT